MQLNIKYFGMLAEVTNCDEEILEFSKTSVNELLDVLISKYPDLQNKDFKLAQNQEIITNNVAISGSEIALLPPFSGG